MKRPDLNPETMAESRAQYKARILRHVAGGEPLSLLGSWGSDRVTMSAIPLAGRVLTRTVASR